MQSNYYYTGLSKALTWLLRHHAVEQGLKISEDGYVLWDDISKMEQFKQYTLSDVKYVVNTNDKKRFGIKEENGKLYIRANQGHSHEVASKIKQDELLTKITEPLDMIVHGTTYQAFREIQKTGLKRMGRAQIHFAVDDNFVTGNQQQSGIRGNCQVLVYLDMKKAMDDGIEFYISENKVVLSPGVGEEGIIEPKYFKKVIDKKSGKIIL
jgi:2'-phosphotransferase